MHAHINKRSRDCDGEYRSGYTMPMTHEESQAESFGEIDFKQRILTSEVSVYAEEAVLAVSREGLEWHEITDEGYRETSVRWCEDDCVDEKAWQRDLSAEAAGY